MKEANGAAAATPAAVALDFKKPRRLRETRSCEPFSKDMEKLLWH